MSKHSPLGYYSNFLKMNVWGKDKAGSKPTEAMVTTAHKYGAPGKQSFALAMAMRDEGVTDRQIKLVLDKPQNNHRRTLVKTGKFAAIPMPQTANPDGGKALNVYRVEPIVEKAKAPRKPRKAKAAVVEAAVEAAA